MSILTEDQWREFINEFNSIPVGTVIPNVITGMNSYWSKKEMFGYLCTAGYVSDDYDYYKNTYKYTKLADAPVDVPLSSFIKNHKGEMLWIEHVILFPGVTQKPFIGNSGYDSGNGDITVFFKYSNFMKFNDILVKTGSCT